MEYKVDKKEAPGWGKVDVLGETYEEGKPEGEELGRWRKSSNIWKTANGTGMAKSGLAVKKGRIQLNRRAV
jgi:hypothetical protein